MSIAFIDSYLGSVRDRPYARLAKARDKISAFVARVLGPIVDRLVHTRPLPEWTNADLFAYGCAIWAYAIALNWYADSLTFVVTGLGVLALWGAIIFGRVEWERRWLQS